MAGPQLSINCRPSMFNDGYGWLTLSPRSSSVSHCWWTIDGYWWLTFSGRSSLVGNWGSAIDDRLLMAHIQWPMYTGQTLMVDHSRSRSTMNGWPSKVGHHSRLMRLKLNGRSSMFGKWWSSIDRTMWMWLPGLSVAPWYCGEHGTMDMSMAPMGHGKKGCWYMQ